MPCRSRDGYLIPKQKIICKCFSRFFESERHLQMILFFTKFRYAESLSPLGEVVIACDDGEGKEVDREAHT